MDCSKRLIAFAVLCLTTVSCASSKNSKSETLVLNAKSNIRYPTSIDKNDEAKVVLICNGTIWEERKWIEDKWQESRDLDNVVEKTIEVVNPWFQSSIPRDPKIIVQHEKIVVAVFKGVNSPKEIVLGVYLKTDNSETVNFDRLKRITSASGEPVRSGMALTLSSEVGDYKLIVDCTEKN
jgi:hypothetical protein